MDKTWDQDSPAQAIIPFTGYYTLDPNVGSFVAVNTTSVWAAAEGKAAPSIEYAATISISSDGQTSQTYTLGQDCSFEDDQLLIKDAAGGTIADLAFSEEAGVCSLAGTIGTATVSGSTPFAPIPLSIWAGTYYTQGTPVQHGGTTEYPYTATLRIDADGTVQFAAPGGTLEPVSTYWYDYAMFVVGLTPALPYLFEMGTSSGWGRVAGNATDGSMLVSIQLQEPAPHL